jgi:cell wall-associated protein
MDPLAEKYYSISLYGFCQNNPVNIIDPDGKSTWVINNSDGTYRIVGGNLKDEDRNIYVYKILDGKLVRDGSIGKTDLMTSFYNSDAREGEGEWAIGSIIDPNDNSGKFFLESFNKEEPSIIEYMTFGVGGKKYDFKREGTKKGDISYNNPIYFYRGMPIKSKNGEMIFSSARDIGNYAAGYIAGHLQIKWEWARRQFDKLESNQKGYNTSEGYSSQNAQYRGWNDGLKSSIDNPLKTLRWTLKTITFIFD